MECLDHAYDPILDYLDGLQWDGKPRLAMWLYDYLGADDTPLNRMIAGLSLVAAVRRARHPGTKFDHVIVLEGLEGMGKSSAVAILAGPENFSDQEILTLDERRQQEALQGVWLYEIAELAGMHRADIERVKAFVTRTMDRTRPAYGRRRVDKARRCVFFASCNSSHYLLSQTGNRRFWPVKCHKVAMDELAGARDQLWAEASMIEARGVGLALPAAFWPAASEVQESRRMRDPWEDRLAHIEEGCSKVQRFDTEYRITTVDLLDTVLVIPVGQQTQIHYNRIGATMRLLGWEGPKTIRMRIMEKSNATKPDKGFLKRV
jgi:predicted P-loop ATPase